MKNYFTHREAKDNYSIIVPTNIKDFPFDTNIGGSYALAPARVLGLTYGEYIRFVSTIFPDVVVIRGKDSKYLKVYWKKGKEMYTFIKMLNKKIELGYKVLEDREK